jgi:hypothetical protein
VNARSQKKKVLKKAAATQSAGPHLDRDAVLSVPAFACQDPASLRWVLCYGSAHLYYQAFEGPFRYRRAAWEACRRLNAQAPPAPKRSSATVTKSSAIL